MKTGARLPRGIRWLGLMALGGVSLAVQAEEKIVLLTSWYAQAEQGGYYQAQATGLYKKYGLDVEIRSGGPQVNGMQLLLSKRADVIIGYDLQLLEGIQRGFQAKAIAAPFQYDPQGLLTHADVTSLQGPGVGSQLSGKFQHFGEFFKTEIRMRAFPRHRLASSHIFICCTE